MKNQLKIIGLDLDGVIIDHALNKVRVASDFGFKLEAKDTPSDVMRKMIPMEVRHRIQDIIYNDPVIAMYSPLMMGAEVGLATFQEAGCPYFLISRRKNPELAIMLLKKHGLWPRYFTKENTIFVKEKEEKNRLAQENKITDYVDDEIGVLEVLDSVPNKFLFDQFGVFSDGSASSPQDFDDYIRVDSWSELVRRLL